MPPASLALTGFFVAIVFATAFIPPVGLRRAGVAPRTSFTLSISIACWLSLTGTIAAKSRRP
jgi:hypothetical protein